MPLMLEWPALSPDLSPTEKCWDYFGQCISHRPLMNNLRELSRSGILSLRTPFAHLSGRLEGVAWLVTEVSTWDNSYHGGQTLLTFHCDLTSLLWVYELRLINDCAYFFVSRDYQSSIYCYSQYCSGIILKLQIFLGGTFSMLFSVCV